MTQKAKKNIDQVPERKYNIICVREKQGFRH
jgi:hypothetical protein